MPMNTGYECNRCHSKKTWASITKLGEAIMFHLNCGNKECGATEDVDITSLGFDLFEPKSSVQKDGAEK